MLSNLNGWHLLILILVVLLIFGAPKLPGLARSLGQSMRIFRSEVKAMKDDDSDVEAAAIEKPQPAPQSKSASSGKNKSGKNTSKAASATSKNKTGSTSTSSK